MNVVYSYFLYKKRVLEKFCTKLTMKKHKIFEIFLVDELIGIDFCFSYLIFLISNLFPFTK